MPLEKSGSLLKQNAIDNCYAMEGYHLITLSRLLKSNNMTIFKEPALEIHQQININLTYLCIVALHSQCRRDNTKCIFIDGIRFVTSHRQMTQGMIGQE